VAVLGAALVLSEPVTGIQVAGIGVALVALAIVCRRPPPSLTEVPEPPL
jgi:drug/metabolite transporter (DMT)-like permease